MSVLTDGTIMPLSPVDSATNELPEIVTVTVTGGLIDEGGGITPLSPFETLVYVDPEVANWVLPVETIVISLSEETPEDSGSSGTLDDGGTIPESAVENIVNVLPVTVSLPGAPGDGVAVGGMIPSPPVDVCVANEKKVVNSPLPLVVDAGTKVGPNCPPPPFVMI